MISPGIFFVLVLASCSRSLSAILDRCGLDLDIALEILGEGLVGDVDFLADELVRPVLACGLDADREDARPDRLAVVVLAVPGDGVLPRRPGCAEIVSIRLVSSACRRLVIAIPALQVFCASGGRAAASGARVPASGR